MVSKEYLRLRARAEYDNARIAWSAVDRGFCDGKTGVCSGDAYAGPTADEIYESSLPTQPSQRYLSLLAQAGIQKQKTQPALMERSFDASLLPYYKAGTAMNFMRMRQFQTDPVAWHRPDTEGWSVTPRVPSLTWRGGRAYPRTRAQGTTKKKRKPYATLAHCSCTRLSRR